MKHALTPQNESKLNEFLKYNKGRFMGFTIQLNNPDGTYHFSGQVRKVTPKFVDVKPFSGSFRGQTRIHKGSLLRVVGFNGLEYTKDL